jgi:hypothetical protein
MPISISTLENDANANSLIAPNFTVTKDSILLGLSEASFDGNFFTNKATGAALEQVDGGSRLLLRQSGRHDIAPGTYRHTVQGILNKPGFIRSEITYE